MTFALGFLIGCMVGGSFIGLLLLGLAALSTRQQERQQDFSEVPLTGTADAMHMAAYEKAQRDYARRRES